MKAIIFTLLFSSNAFCDLLIVTSHNNQLKNITKKDIANLYLGKTNTIQGIKVTPIDSKDNKTYKEFYQKVVKKNLSQLQAYWIKQIYAGHKQPPKRLTSTEVKNIKTKKNFIAYSKDALTGKIILTIK